MPITRRITFQFALLCLCLGCHGFGPRFGPPRSETLARLRPMPIASAVLGRFEIDLASKALSGTFDAICDLDGTVCRLQLFPDIGGKVFDLRLEAAAIVADLPGAHYEATPPLELAEPHLALVLAAVLAELLAPVTASRVLGERLAADGRPLLQLQPALGSGSVEATLAADGSVAAYAIELGYLEFGLSAVGELHGRGMTGQLRFPGRDWHR